MKGVEIKDVHIPSRVFIRLNKIEHLYPCVLWIRDPSYTKQIYVGPAYEKYWGYSCYSLYDNPLDWNDYLVTDNKRQPIKNLQLEIPR